jgi:hypothetical protein
MIVNVNGGDLGGRLDAFLEWVRDGGVAAARFPAWRPIAEKLLALAGSGRVLEGHILSLIDQSQGSPGQIALIEEVGEALLRHQALAKPTEPKPTREIPKLVTPAIQRASSPPRPAGAREPMLTPPPSPGASDGPTSRLRLSTPVPVPAPPSGDKLVSFATSVPTPPPSLAVGSTPPASPRPRRVSNVHFRCPKCKVMVAANPDGVCPTCGTRPPTATMTSAEPRPPRRWVRAAVAGGLVVVLVALTGYIVDRASHPSVAGSFPARSIGLEVTLADGWRRRNEGQADLGALGIDEPMAVARFVRHDDRLALASAARPLDFDDARLGQLADAGPDKVAASLRALDDGLRLDACLAEGRRLRCLGAHGDRRVAAYVVLLPKRVAVAVMVSDRNLEDTTAEADALVESLKPL